MRRSADCYLMVASQQHFQARRHAAHIRTLMNGQCSAATLGGTWQHLFARRTQLTNLCDSISYTHAHMYVFMDVMYVV